MTDAELKKRMKDYAMGWKETGEYLEAERHAQVRKTNTMTGSRAFDGIVTAALKRFPVANDSGLIEQQRLFMKMHLKYPAE